MAPGNESKKSSPKTRQSSLRYHKLREVTPVPEFFEKDTLPQPSDHVVNQPSGQNDGPHSKQFHLTMNKIGLFGFLLTLTFVGVLLFSSGFMVAYTIYALNPQSTSAIQQPTTNPTLSAPSAINPSSQDPSPPMQSFMQEKALATQQSVTPQANSSALEAPSNNTLAESFNANVPIPSIEDLQKDPSQIPLNKEDLQKNVEDIQGNSIDTALQLSAEKVSSLTLKTASGNATTAEIPQPPFAIEFGRTDAEQTAREMLKEMTQQNIKGEISRSINEHGKVTYHVRSPFYNDYETAYNALIKLARPFSLWGTIVRSDMKETPEIRR
jgi:hypothetical protein